MLLCSALSGEHRIMSVFAQQKISSPQPWWVSRRPVVFHCTIFTRRCECFFGLLAPDGHSTKRSPSERHYIKEAQCAFPPLLYVATWADRTVSQPSPFHFMQSMCAGVSFIFVSFALIFHSKTLHLVSVFSFSSAFFLTFWLGWPNGFFLFIQLWVVCFTFNSFECRGLCGSLGQ